MIRIPHPSRDLLEVLETVGVLPVPPVAVPPVAVPREKGQCIPQQARVLTRLTIMVALGAAFFIGWRIGRMGQVPPAKQTPRSLVILRGY